MVCVAVGGMWLVAGVALFLQFFRFHAPGGESPALFPMGPNGHYFAAFAGAALVAWGGCLLGAARRPWLGRSVGTATALGLVMCAVARMLAWLVGDYARLGNLPRIEAGVFLCVALALLWLRPPALAAENA